MHNKKQLTLTSAAIIAVAFMVSGCSSSSVVSRITPSFVPKLGFSPSWTGTSASPRVWNGNRRVRKGGGRYKVGAPYTVAGKRYYPREDKYYDRVGVASWYGDDFHGRLTANGEVYDMNALTAAHPTLPLPSLVKVTNLKNNRSLIVRVNDRGPYVNDRLIDLSRKTADLLGLRHAGLAKVRVQYVGRAPLNGDDSYERRYAQGYRSSTSWFGF